MIARLRTWNFGCAKDVSLELRPLTLLAGPNASGKSTLLRALAFPQLGRPENTGQASIELEFDPGDGRENVQFRLSANSWSGNSGRDACQPLRLDLNALRQANTAAPQYRIQPNGAELANVIYTLGRNNIAALSKRLCELVPVFSDVDIRPAPGMPGQIEVVFQDAWTTNRWFRPFEVSDGTMLLLAFLVLQYQSPAPELILIEEPERGLHPYLLTELVTILRKLSVGEFGKPIQVVMATHSGDLLDRVKPEEVRFLSRDPGTGGTIVEQIETADPNWPKAFEEYRRSLSQVWLSGAVGGVPT